MKKVRALFTCRQVSIVKTQHMEQTEVQLHPVNEGPFWEATPMGNLEMTISNKDAAAFFEAGKDYYLDFEEAPER